jgi:signal-transduction protein with cAMP-binding, CBS, and nucleotidyltransferase domain
MPRLKDIFPERALSSAETGQSVAEVARAMAARKVGAILVLENGQLRGVFSERDLMTRVVVAGLDPAATPVDRVMSTNLSIIQETASVEEAMQLMRQCNCRHLPVMRGQQVTGFISMRDLMLYELERKTDELHHIHRYIQSV